MRVYDKDLVQLDMRMNLDGLVFQPCSTSSYNPSYDANRLIVGTNESNVDPAVWTHSFGCMAGRKILILGME